MQYDEKAADDYLAHIAMKWLTNAHREHLMAPLHPDEVVAALKDMSNGKAPGVDGATVAFYKAYHAKLIPHLITLYEKMVKDGCKPPSMYEALLIIMLKPGKPADICSSYRLL